MLEVLSTYHYIIIFASVIIVSYFFNSFSKSSGVPSVLMLIGLGMVIGFYVPWQNKFSFILEVLGTVGLILIVLEVRRWHYLRKISLWSSRPWILTSNIEKITYLSLKRF